ncbi:DUF1015 family protein [Nonomuraea sp. NPDC050790]|uniref:DUF1015 family protein n=1 Tax=Nonomuraea sp. NPDC050790 TaxID=3364371 RepID=UPI00378AD50B
MLRPFRGVRFAVDDPGAVTSPPYDLISDDDVQSLLDSHPNNVVRLILPRPPARPAQRYGAARDALRTWLADGVLIRDDHPALYVYEQQAPGILQRGLIGDVGLAAPEQRIILPHENVMPGPVADRLALMSTTQANLEPILLLYNGNDPATHQDTKDTPTAGYRGSGTSGSAASQGRASRLVDEVATTRPPLVTAETSDGVRHSLWAITDQAEIDAVNADLRQRQALIADGHHRYATYRELQRLDHTRRPSTTPTTQPTADAPTAVTAQPAADAPPAATTLTPTDAPPPATAQPAADAPTSPTAPTAPDAPPPAATPTSTDAPSPATAPTGTADRQGPATNTPTYSSVASPTDAASGEPTGPWDFGLALLVDSDTYPPDLKAIHRVIPALPLEEAAARAKGAWRVQDFADLPSGLAALQEAHEPAFLLAGEGGGHLLTDPDPVQLARAMPDDRSARWNALNTSVLTEFVLPKVWGMRDDEVDVRIVHHDAQAAADLATSCGGTAVILNALAVDDVLAVAAEGERVPRKSTSFGPKPRTGLVLRTLDTS